MGSVLYSGFDLIECVVSGIKIHDMYIFILKVINFNSLGIRLKIVHERLLSETE